jgi:adenosylmethionine-8-amino-7-oxononanoate aminotransferase
LQAFLEQNGQRIAALIVEPLVQGAAGMAMHDPEYLRLARALCDQYEVHLICDEIAVGCGRTGTFFAHEQAGIKPDFLCLSKGISGGYLPLSVVLTTDTVYAAFYDDAATRGFLHSHSYTGNALACRAALATLDIFETDNVLHNNVARGALLESLLQPLAEHPQVRHFRRRGMILAFDVDTDAANSASFGRRFYREALARELLLRPMGNTVYFMPPYILGEEDAAFLARNAAAALEAALK